MELMYPTNNPYTFDKVYGSTAIKARRREGWSTVSVKIFGKKLRKIRARMDLTQEKMVYLLNDLCRPTFCIDLRQYQRWEKGKSLKRFLCMENLYAISDALHIPIDYLCGDEKKLPPIWAYNSPLVSPAKSIDEEVVEKVTLHVYAVHARYRGEVSVHTVQAESKIDAHKYFMEEFRGAEISSVRLVPPVAGVIT